MSETPRFTESALDNAYAIVERAGVAIRTARLSASDGLTDAAQRVGIHKQFLYRLESGQNPHVQVSSLARLLDAYGLTLVPMAKAQAERLDAGRRRSLWYTADAQSQIRLSLPRQSA